MATDELGEASRTVPAATSLERTVQKIHDAIFVGDGRVGGSPGLLPAVEQLLRDVAQMKGEKDKKLSIQQGFGLAVAGGVLTQSFAFVLHFIKEAFRQ